MLELVISNVITLVVAIIGSGLIMNSIQKRKGNAETDSIVLEQMQLLNNKLQDTNDKLTAQCSRLYDDISSHRDAKIELREEITKLKIELNNERIYRCERPCSKRVPPSEDKSLNID